MLWKIQCYAELCGGETVYIFCQIVTNKKRKNGATTIYKYGWSYLVRVGSVMSPEIHRSTQGRQPAPRRIIAPCQTMSLSHMIPLTSFATMQRNTPDNNGVNNDNDDNKKRQLQPHQQHIKDSDTVTQRNINDDGNNIR